MQVNPYLYFGGQCEEAFRFYEKVLGGKIAAMIPHQGSPAEGHVPPEWASKIMHARLTFGENGVLMASDAPPEHFEKPQGFSVNLSVKDPAEADRLYNELSVGGKVSMPIQKTFWATRFAMFSDRYGIPWMINCEG